MNDYLSALREDVARLLASQPASENQFIHLAVAGERLRRVELAEEDAGATEDLSLYDAYLASRPDCAPHDFEANVHDVLKELTEYANSETNATEAVRGENLLDELDEMLSVLVAASRAGASTSDSVMKAGDDARRVVRQLAPKLTRLAEAADRHVCQVAADPDYPSLYCFWDEVARFAAARVAIAMATRQHSRKARIVHLVTAAVPAPAETIVAVHDLYDAIELATESNRISAELQERVETYARTNPGPLADWFSATAMQLRRRLDESVELADRSMLRALEDNDFCAALRAGARKASVLQDMRRRPDALALVRRLRETTAKEAIEQAQQANDAALIARTHLLAARLSATASDWPTTKRHAQEALHHANDADLFRTACSARLFHTVAILLLKEEANVLSRLRECADEAAALEMYDTLRTVLRFQGALLLDQQLPELARNAFARAHASALAHADTHDQAALRALELVAQSRIATELRARIKTLSEAERQATSVQEWDLASHATVELANARRESEQVRARQDLGRATQYAHLAGDAIRASQLLLQQIRWLVEDGEHARARSLLTVLSDGAERIDDGARREVMYLQWVCALAAGDMQAAMKWITDFVKLAEADHLVRVELAVTYAANGRPDDCLAELKRLESVEEVDRAGVLACPAIVFERDRSASFLIAAECVRLATQSRSESFVAAAHFVRGQVYLASQNIEDATKDLKAVMNCSDVEHPLLASAQLLLVVADSLVDESRLTSDHALAVATSDAPLVVEQLELVREILHLDVLRAREEYAQAIGRAHWLRCEIAEPSPDLLVSLAWNDVHCWHMRATKAGVSETVALVGMRRALAEVAQRGVLDSVSTETRAMHELCLSVIAHWEGRPAETTKRLDAAIGLLPPSLDRWAKQLRAQLPPRAGTVPSARAELEEMTGAAPLAAVVVETRSAVVERAKRLSKLERFGMRQPVLFGAAPSLQPGNEVASTL